MSFIRVFLYIPFHFISSLFEFYTYVCRLKSSFFSLFLYHLFRKIIVTIDRALVFRAGVDQLWGGYVRPETTLFKTRPPRTCLNGRCSLSENPHLKLTILLQEVFLFRKFPMRHINFMFGCCLSNVRSINAVKWFVCLLVLLRFVCIF